MSSAASEETPRPLHSREWIDLYRHARKALELPHCDAVVYATALQQAGKRETDGAAPESNRASRGLHDLTGC